MKNNLKIQESPLFWPAHIDGKVLLVLDETLIPAKVKYIKVRNTKEAVQVIREMKTRAFGQFLVVLNTFLLELENGRALSPEALVQKLQATAEALNKSRPTFPFAEVTSVVTGWAQAALAQQQDIKTFVSKNVHGYLQGIRYRRLERVQKIAELIKNGDSVLTHCNVSGELAMAAKICQQQKKKIRFFATETRPYLQGTKLTCWELKKMGADVTLIADNAVGSVMADGLVNKVIVGSDRSCANGDFANKIGTYQIAVLAKEFEIPFYVLTQPSSKIACGEDIPIEIRDEKELLNFERKPITKAKVKGFYPGFDVVSHELITQAVAINAGQ
ncbi:MAG: hypothetical protein A2787_07360 [Omnitrophica WOR_2 bacterium RIFCSPHIGHO2_01_FULL_48_9]|nr:MAG: hypothetical protein A2787_07360 [Omnitrophica WOR_2 bacterium RIFCSPHIGHO2_01_FULL_48_9]